MSEIALTPNVTQTLDRLERTARGAVLITPLLLLHAHGIAEGAIALADLCFLIRCHMTGDWAWARSRWVMISLAWWAWLVICSAPVPGWHLGEGGIHSFVQALVFGRFMIFIAALEHWVLRAPETRRWLYWIIAACVGYIAIHVVFQAITGVNFYGWKGGPDGELTGPFGKPRAGAPYARIMLPVVVPLAAAMLTRPGVRPMILAMASLAGGLVISVLIGQRMPLLLAAFGLVISAVFLRRLRLGVVLAGVVAAALLAASPVIAPGAYHRVVVLFTQQMTHFASTHYGKLYARAWEVGVRNPVTGLGAEGFNTGCSNPDYFRPTFDGLVADGGGKEICWDHPHQYYLEALDTGGVPGLILFTGLSLAWVLALGRGLWRDPDPLCVALFAAAFVHVWPIAAATSFTSMPTGGWSFLLLGWGLAEAAWRKSEPAAG